MSTSPKEVLRSMINDGNLKTAEDLHSYLKAMFKDALQEMLEAELEMDLGYSKGDKKNKSTDNRRSGYSQKTINTQFAELPIEVPRDIHEQIKDIYGIEISAEMVSKMTDSIISNIIEWQNSPFNPIYPFVFMDVIHCKVREDGRIKNKAAYVVLGVDLNGFKDILGIWIVENQSSKFWLGLLNDLKNRGLQEVLIFSIDGLTGLKKLYLRHIQNQRYKDASFIS